MKNGNIVYVVCMTDCTPDGGWPCAAFATKEDALKECKRLCEKAKINQENMWRRTLGKRRYKKMKFSVDRVQERNGMDGYGVQRDDKEMVREYKIYAKIYYVQKYELGKKADKRWGW